MASVLLDATSVPAGYLRKRPETAGGGAGIPAASVPCRREDVLGSPPPCPPRLVVRIHPLFSMDPPARPVAPCCTRLVTPVRTSRRRRSVSVPPGAK